MVEVELLAGEFTSTVLAHVVVPGIYVKPAKPYLAFRDSIITHKENHPWHPYAPTDQSDIFVVYRNREVAPTCKIKGLILFVHDPG
jgi:hypothetical protein